MRSSFTFSLVALATAALAVAAPGTAAAVSTVSFASGSLIIPMDVDYQDVGMLTAFGLLDKLLRAGVPVAWSIKTPKAIVDAAAGRFEDDFTASATDFKTGAAIASHGYRGGPFVIAASDATLARPVITAWQAGHTTTVHVATAAFSAPVSRRLTAAPRIAILADGHEDIAFSYLNAAGILDESNHAWSLTSPSVLTPAQVAGPTSTAHNDGALFRPSGQPAFCEIMTMHWSVTDPAVPEVSAEMGEFLKFPVHLNAECQAVNAIEGAPPTGGRMKFVAPQGFVWPAPAKPSAVEYSNSSLPFAQQDGAFGTVGGSEPAYALPAGTAYYDSGIVMVRAMGVAPGKQDVWMTGYAGGACKIDGEGSACTSGSKGKVSYLGGHQYTVKTPMTTNKTTQGTRLFLNSLYEAGCVTGEGQPDIELILNGAASTTTPQVTWEVFYQNAGEGPALGVVLTDTLPPGATFVSASDGGTFAGGVVTWNIGDSPSGHVHIFTVTVQLGAPGTYVNRASGQYTVGLNSKTVQATDLSVEYQLMADGGMEPDAAPDAGTGGPDAGADAGCAAGCPAPQNPCQKATCVAGSCVLSDDDGKACAASNKCLMGSTCMAGVCQGGTPLTCAPPSNSCQTALCDPQFGCRFVAAGEGQPCDDGDACTTGTVCAAGLCAGGAAVTCAGQCSLSMCDPADGCGVCPGGDGGVAAMDASAGDGGGVSPGDAAADLPGVLADAAMMSGADGQAATPEAGGGGGQAGAGGGGGGAGGGQGGAVADAGSSAGADAGPGALDDGGGSVSTKKGASSGCSCTLGERRSRAGAAPAAALLLGLLVARRRRRR
jgi:uncharacterized repeat protein (TIGR01451 family)/MYXO-CTERM domain-containing protein